MDSRFAGGSNWNMNRCLSCSGLVTRQDSVCYTCGVRLPKREKLAARKPITPLSSVLFLLSLALTAYSFLASHKLPLAVSLAPFGIYLLVRLGERVAKKLRRDPVADYFNTWA